jgi:glucosamine-6-phosphate deaminase
MDIVVKDTVAEVAAEAARIIVGLVVAKPDAVLGLATGSTPLPVYEELAKCAKYGVDFSMVRGFALDEYVGLPLTHPESYHSVIRRYVTEPLGMNPELVHVPNGAASDVDAAARQYEEMIDAAGGIDVQILGIGANGHIGFNEPGSDLFSRTRSMKLDWQTRVDNSRFFDSLEDVPEYCVTQGLGTIMEARKLLLLGVGERKAAAIEEALHGKVSVACPASVVQTHSNVLVLLDKAAAHGA